MTEIGALIPIAILGESNDKFLFFLVRVANSSSYPNDISRRSEYS